MSQLEAQESVIIQQLARIAAVAIFNSINSKPNENNQENALPHREPPGGGGSHGMGADDSFSGDHQQGGR